MTALPSLLLASLFRCAAPRESGWVGATRDQWTQCQRYVWGEVNQESPCSEQLAFTFILKRQMQLSISRPLSSSVLTCISTAVRDKYCRHCRRRLCPWSSSDPYGYQTYLTQDKASLIQTGTAKFDRSCFGACTLDTRSRAATPRFYSIKVRLPPSTEIILLSRSHNTSGRVRNDRHGQGREVRLEGLRVWTEGRGCG